MPALGPQGFHIVSCPQDLMSMLILVGPLAGCTPVEEERRL